MIFVIYDPITKEVACTFDAYEGDLIDYGRFEIKEFTDDVIPTVNIYDNGTALLEESTVILTPEYFNDDEQEYYYDDEEEEDD